MNPVSKPRSPLDGQFNHQKLLSPSRSRESSIEPCPSFAGFISFPNMWLVNRDVRISKVTGQVSARVARAVAITFSLRRFSALRDKRETRPRELSWLPSLVIFTFRGTSRHRATAQHITIRDESVNEEKGISVENPLAKKKEKKRKKERSVEIQLDIRAQLLFSFSFFSFSFFLVPRRITFFFLCPWLTLLGDYCNYCWTVDFRAFTGQLEKFGKLNVRLRIKYSAFCYV